MAEPESVEDVLAAIEDGPRGDLGRRYAAAEPVVDEALANLMAMVDRAEGNGPRSGRGQIGRRP